MSQSNTWRMLHAFGIALALCGLTQVCGCGGPPVPPAAEGTGDAGTLSGRDSAGADRQWHELEIEVTGNDFQWQYRYPGCDRQLGTDDDRWALRDVHVPAHAKVKLFLKSRDYLYTYAIPEFDKKEIAVPEMTFEIDFTSADCGRFEFRGDQFCGYSHPQLSGQVVVESNAEFNRWLDSLDSYQNGN